MNTYQQQPKGADLASAAAMSALQRFNTNQVSETDSQKDRSMEVVIENESSSLVEEEE